MSNYVFKRRANYYETDKMGIVHHTNYIRYFEEARIDFMRSIGCSCKALEEQNVMIPVVDAYAKYHKSVLFDDQMLITPRLVKFNGAKMVFSYEIRLAETGELAVTGRTSHCFVTFDQRKPISIKRKYSDEYQAMVGHLEPEE